MVSCPSSAWCSIETTTIGKTHSLFFYSFEKIHFWFFYHHVKGTPYKHQKFSNLTEAENFIVENNTTNGTKKENEDKENHYEKILNPDKKPKLELLHGGDQPSGENLKARKVSKT